MPARPALVLFACAVLAGCGGSGRAPTFPTTGTVTVGGKPAAGALVVFHPRPATDSNAPRPVGVVGPDGTFRLTTFEANDGAPAGSYAVTVAWRPRKKAATEPDGPDRLKGKYLDPTTTTLTATVEPRPTTVPAFALE